MLLAGGDAEKLIGGAEIENPGQKHNCSQKGPPAGKGDSPKQNDRAQDDPDHLVGSADVTCHNKHLLSIPFSC